MKPINLPKVISAFQRLDFPHKLGFCERLFGRSLSAHGICWVHTGAGIAWKLNLANPTHRWIVYGKYEGRAFLDWAKKFLPRDGIVVDSGANIGQMLLYLAAWVPQGKVLAFEPGREQYEWLEECLAVHPNLPVEVIRKGLGAAPAELHLKNVGPSNVHGAWSQITEEEGETVCVVKLEAELDARAISEIDLWKLDVEGYEVPALRGAESLLKGKRVKALYVELSGDNSIRVRNYLASVGYECYLFGPHGKLYKAAQLPSHTNGLFLPV